MLENYAEFILLTLRTRNLKKPLGMQAKIGNTNGSRCALQGLQEKTRMKRSVARLVVSSLSLHVYWKPVNLQDCLWGESLPNRHEDHIAGKGDNSLQHYNLVHKFMPMPQAMKIPAAKAAVVKEWEELEKISAWNLTKVRSKKEVIDEARTKGAKVHFASLMDICHLTNAELEKKHQK